MNSIESEICSLHGNDKEQLDIVFSNEQKVMVEAPAGHGKTKVLISKIAYMLTNNEIADRKKILTLTFGVNAAYKIKKDILSYLPDLLSTDPLYRGKKLDNLIKDKMFTTNYHGFCRRVLNLYGYLLKQELKDIQNLSVANDFNVQSLLNLRIGLTRSQAEDIVNFNNHVKEAKRESIKKDFNSYNNIIKQVLIPNGYITHNAIITLTLNLFSKHKEVLALYNNYFSVIIVDEFQDTNVLTWTLLKVLISKETRLLLLGDSLQRIYGFIGAIPNLLDEAAEKYEMAYKKLTKNYRFRHNEKMLLLDKIIRTNARNPQLPSIAEEVVLPLFLGENQEKESNWIAKKIQELNKEHVKISILIRQRTNNIEYILKTLDREGISYYNGLFKDTDLDYIQFHEICLKYFLNNHSNKPINNSSLNEAYRQIKESIGQVTPSIDSYLKLLDVFLKQVLLIAKGFSNEEKLSLILDTFSHNSLKDYMEYINENLIVTTVFGAKGLEWDYVILPDMEQESFPNWSGMCRRCSYSKDCSLKIDEKNESEFIEELNVFYVAVTRARKQVLLSASKETITFNGESKEVNLSCFLQLPGITVDVSEKYSVSTL